MTLPRLLSALATAALAAGLLVPAGAEEVFQNVSTGRIAPLPTPTGISLYDAYFYPCNGYWGGGGGHGRGYGHGSNSGIGTINGERFYPYDPRSTSHYGRGNQWNCYNGQGGGHHTNPRPPRPEPTRLPLPNPPRRIPQAAPTPRS